MFDISKKLPRVMFLFSSPRQKIISEVQVGQSADTALRGMNHIQGADYIAIGEHKKSDALSWLSATIPRALQSLMLVPQLLQYNFVIAQDDLFLGYFVSTCSSLLRLKTRWIYVAISSSTLMRRHAAHPVRMFLLKKFWASYARIICFSHEQINDFRRLGISRDRLVFIPFGVDTDFFRPADAPREEDFIVSVGRDAGRDYTTLFKAAERVGYKLIVVASPQNIPSDRPIPLNVSVLYNQSLIETKNLYARARFVVVPSKDISVSEGSDCSGQTVVLDALATNKAVIATRRSWITDYVIPGEDLIIVEPNDPEALARAIDSLWHDSKKRKHLAESGHVKVVTRYTTKKFAQALMALMDSINQKS